MRPNFLFIILDDLNSWIGALGAHPDVRTPNIDALARRGSLFAHAYCSAPYCNASRMGLFSGQYPATNGVFHNEPFWEDPDRPITFLELLNREGYYTIGSGKVFHGVFDYANAGKTKADHAVWNEQFNKDFLWSRFQQMGPEPLPADRPANQLFDFSDFDSVPNWYHHFDWGPIPDEYEALMPDTRTANFVKEFLESQPQAPFFCAAGLYKPHLPWNVPRKYFDLYDRDTITLPLVRNDDLDDVPAIAKKWALNPPDHELVTSRRQWPDAVRGYLASISYADAQVGIILRALESSGVDDNTVVVLCSDNGFHLGEKLHWRKFVLWEEATRVPVIISPPKSARRRQIVSTPVSLIDLYPTILQLAGVEIDPVSDAVSLVPLLSGETTKRGAPVAMTWGSGNDSLRSENWRYTRYEDGTEELYDHRCDPREWTNLANDSFFDEIKRSLRNALPSGDKGSVNRDKSNNGPGV